MPVSLKNRISDLLEAAPSPRARRTAAQREASRRNGAKSGGPRTAAGKARSRMNSLAHGLFARVIAPPADIREEDRLFWRLRAELVAETRAAALSRLVLIDSIAADLVQIARARRMLEVLQQPVVDNPHERSAAASFSAMRQDLELVQSAIESQGASPAQPLDAEQAGRLATLVLDHLTTAEESVADENDPDVVLDEFDEKEIAGHRALLTLAEPARPLLWNREALVAALTGRKRLPGDTRQRLRDVLADLEQSLQQWFYGRRDLREKLLQSSDRWQTVLAYEPQRLMALQQYLLAWERSVERKLRQLRAEE